MYKTGSSAERFLLLTMLQATILIAPGIVPDNRVYATTLSGSITSDTTINYGDIAGSAVAVTIEAGYRLLNFGTIVAGGTLTNEGRFISYGTFKNLQTFTNDNMMTNYGTMINESIGTINNTGTLNNYGSLSNDNAIYNTGTLNNYGTLNNSNTIYNPGTLNNYGVLNNSASVYNNGTLNNYGIVSLTGGEIAYYAGLGSKYAFNNFGTLRLGSSNNDINGILNQSGGTIDFTYDNQTRTSSYRTLSVATLNGTGALKINTNLSSGTGDSITAYSVASGTALSVSVTYDSLMDATTGVGTVYSGSGYSVATGSGASNITLTGATSDYGAYSYTPTFSGTTLTSLKAGVGTNTKAAAGSAAAQSNVMQTSVNHLKKRLGELRNAPDAENGIWTRVYSGEVTNSRYDSVTSEYSGLQMGYDKKKDVKNGKTYTGAAFSYTDADNTFTRGSGNSKAYDLALYHTWIGDSGHYYDLIAKRGRLDSDYQVTDLSSNHSSAAYKTWTDSLAVEYGYRKQLPNRWYLEPQAELTYGHINGVNYTTTSGLSVKQEAIDRLIGRLGVETGRSFNQGSSAYYATLSGLHEFKDQENLQAGTLHYSEDMSGTWGELLLGYSTKMSDHSNSLVNVEKLFGKDVSSNWQINVGLRFGF